MATLEENEAIRKAAEDKAYSEDLESKTIEEQRKVLLAELAAQEAALKEREPKTYDLPVDGKMHDRLVLVPLVDELTGQILVDTNGNVQYVARVFEDKATPADQNLNARLLGPWDTETADTVLFRQDGELYWPDTTGLSERSSTSEIIDYLKTNGPFVLPKYNSSADNTNSIDSIVFAPPLMLESLPRWRDLKDTLSQEVQVLEADLSAQKSELAQLAEAENNIRREIDIKETELAIAEGDKAAAELIAPGLAAAAQAAMELMDSLTPGTPEYAAAEAAFNIAVDNEQANLGTLAQANADIDLITSELLQLDIDLTYVENRIPIVQALVEAKTVGLFNLNNSVLELGVSIGQAEDWRNKILAENPDIENGRKEEQDRIKAAEAGIAKSKADLEYLAANESWIRDRIRQEQNKEAIKVATDIVGELGPLNAAGQPISPTGAIGAAFKKSQDVAAQLNKPVYTEAELKEIARQNASADELTRYRAKRTDKGKMGFSGCDITAVLRVPGYSRGKTSLSENLIFQLGTLQTIAISTYNAKTPIKSIGFKNPIAIARGGRTIAGTMIFNQLHRHVFDDNAYGEVVNDDSGFLTYSQGDTQYFISSQEIRNQNTDPYAAAIAEAESRKAAGKSATITQVEFKNKIERFKPGTTNESFKPKQYDYASFEPKKFKDIEGPWKPADEVYLTELIERQVFWNKNLTKGYLSDEDIKNKSYINKKKLKKQWDFSWDTSLVGERIKPSDLPPFDIIIMLVNEMGNLGKIILYGVEIIHDSQTLSVEDIYTEAQYQYIAKDIEYFHADDFQETKAWVSNLPKYGYKGFYLANIERAQNDLNKFKSKNAQEAYELAATLGARAAGITDGIKSKERIKQITLDKLKAELADLQSQLDNLGDASATGVKDLQDLLFATRDLLTQKEEELKQALTSTTSDYAFWKVQLTNLRNRANAIKEAGIFQREAGVGIPQIDQRTRDNLFDWDAYFRRNNEYFISDPEVPVTFPPFYPLLPFPQVTENPAKFVYEFFYEQRKISQQKLDEALSKFKNGADIDNVFQNGYKVFWDNLTYAGTANKIEGYPQTGIIAQKELQYYAERFPAYARDRDMNDKILANAEAQQRVLNDIYMKYPLLQKGSPIVNSNPTQVTPEEIGREIESIIQTELGPLEFSQHSWVHFFDRAKVKQGFAEGLSGYNNGTATTGTDEDYDYWMDNHGNGKEADGRYPSFQTDNNSKPDEPFDTFPIDYTVPGILVKRTREKYRVYRNENNNYSTGIFPDEPYPTRIFVKTPGKKDVIFEERFFRYHYFDKTRTDAQGALDKFLSETYVPLTPLAIPPSLDQTLSSMTVYDYLLLVFMTAEEVEIELTKRGYYNLLPGAVGSDGKPINHAGYYLELTVKDFLDENKHDKERYRKDPTYFDEDGWLEPYLLAVKLENEFFAEISKKYVNLELDVDDETQANESIVEVTNSEDSWTDLRNKAAFYEFVLRTELNKDRIGEKEEKIKDLMNQINEKRRTIGLVTTGQYDDAAEQQRSSALSNTQSGPTEFGGGVQAVPVTRTPVIIPSATSVPEEPEETAPAPEQTSTVRPPKTMSGRF